MSQAAATVVVGVVVGAAAEQRWDDAQSQREVVVGLRTVLAAAARSGRAERAVDCAKRAD
jgi:hypothetical protein